MFAGKSAALCSVPYCRKKREKNRSVCRRCRKRQYVEANPLRAKYSDLKHRAKQRGHAFLLTFEEFKKFCEDTKYLELRGKSAESMSIDRIREWEPYQAGNLQMLTLSENCRKSNAYRRGEVVPADSEEAPF